MKKYYVGSLIWNDDIHDIFIEKPFVKYLYGLEYIEMKEDFVYTAKGEIIVGIKSPLRQIIYESYTISDYLTDILPFLPFPISKLCRINYIPELGKYFLNDEIIAYAYEGIKTVERPKSQCRRAFYPIKLFLHSDLYAGLEFKGCGSEGKAINLNKFRFIGNTQTELGPEGGMYYEEGKQEIENQENFYLKRKVSPLSLIAFKLPIEIETSKGERKKLGLLTRAVKSSIRTSEVWDIKNELLEKLHISGTEYCKKYTLTLFNDFKKIVECGYFHFGPHHGNIELTGNITDLGGLLRIQKYEDIYFDVRNYLRITRDIWKLFTGDDHFTYIIRSIRDIFDIRGDNIKEISLNIFRNMAKK
jgi:hypothetical protein